MHHIHPGNPLKNGKRPSDRHEKRKGHRHRHDAVPNLHGTIDSRRLEFGQSKSMNCWKSSANHQNNDYFEARHLGESFAISAVPKNGR